MATPLIHQTDLFRPHNDPDDHFDLAVVYALAFQGRIDLRGVVIDHPPPQFDGDPDVVTAWQPDSRSTHRMMFMVRDVHRYASAMTKALRGLLTALP